MIDDDEREVIMYATFRESYIGHDDKIVRTCSLSGPLTKMVNRTNAFGINHKGMVDNIP